MMSFFKNFQAINQCTEETLCTTHILAENGLCGKYLQFLFFMLHEIYWISKNSKNSECCFCLKILKSHFFQRRFTLYWVNNFEKSYWQNFAH